MNKKTAQKKKKPSAEENKEESEGLGEKGRKMKEEESDQDFNFW